MKTRKLDLPKTMGPWSRPETPRIIDSTNENKNNILVELYFMETPDDAFGLLSLDWGGEVVSLGDPSANGLKQPPAPSVRALYGAGLLRIWSDNLYARVMLSVKRLPQNKL